MKPRCQIVTAEAVDINNEVADVVRGLQSEARNVHGVEHSTVTPVMMSSAALQSADGAHCVYVTVLLCVTADPPPVDAERLMAGE